MWNLFIVWRLSGILRCKWIIFLQCGVYEQDYGKNRNFVFPGGAFFGLKRKIWVLVRRFYGKSEFYGNNVWNPKFVKCVHLR